MKGAKYVAYTLDGDKVNAVNIKKHGKFYTGKNLPKKYRSYSKDYVHSGYDRGHLANASFDYSKKIVRKTYSMANIYYKNDLSISSKGDKLTNHLVDCDSL